MCVDVKIKSNRFVGNTNNIIEINRFLHKSLLKIWDLFHGCEKRRRISHTSGRNPRSSIETSVRTYFFHF
jgi:hypothetical protein